MKLIITILFITVTSCLNAQTFLSMSGGTSTKKDVSIHANIGYQYSIVSLQAGFIGAPLNTDRPLFITWFTSVDLLLNKNWKVVPIAGIAAKTWEPGKNSEVKTDAYLGARLQYDIYFLQASHFGSLKKTLLKEDQPTYFFSVGFKGYIKERE